MEIFTLKEYALYKKQKILQNSNLSDTIEDYNYINNLHDKIFRKSLNNKNDTLRIINKLLKENDKMLLDDIEIEKYNSSYITNKLKNSEADIVYKVKDKEVFFLIEHQTKIDYSMPYRILKYEVDIIESFLIDKKYNRKNFKYPVVIPIVLYTGKRKWDANLDLRENQLKWNNNDGIEFSKYNIIDVNDFDNEELLNEESFISKLMLIEKSKTEKELIENFNKIKLKMNNKNNIYTQEQKELLIILMYGLLEKKVGKEKANKKINILKKEGGDSMLAVYDMIDRENERIRLEGKREGKREGKKEGKKEGKIEVAKKLLNKEMTFKDIQEVTGLSIKVIENLKKV